MDLRHLRYFLAVAEEQHFGRAAQRLHVVQPALSMQIRALERELGGPLFARTSRRVELTDAGMLLREEAERLLAQADNAENRVRNSIRGGMGRIRVGFSGNAVFTGRIMNDVRAFQAARPNVRLSLYEMASQAQVAAILGGQLDVGYGPAPERLDNRLTSVKVGEWPFIAALSKQHRLAAQAALTPEMMAEEPLIAYTADDAREGIPAALRRVLGCEPHTIHHATNTLSILALAAAGLGLALVPATFGTVAIPNLIYKEITGLAIHSDLFFFSRSFETANAVRAFISLTHGDADGDRQARAKRPRRKAQPMT